MLDYLIIGAGLFGSAFASIAKKNNKSVLVLEKRPHIAGNIFTKSIEKINVHVYGAHIFHTNNKQVWDFVNNFATFNNFLNSPVANYKGELFSLPFNMWTFNKMWGVATPKEAQAIIEKEKRSQNIDVPKNLREQAISLVGVSIFEKLIDGYTQKQWGRPCTSLPPSIIKRLPVRFTFNNNYFDALYQGIPQGGYTKMIENMLEGIEVKTNVDYLKNKNYYDTLANKIIYTGQIDQYFDYRFGALEYRSLEFRSETLDTPNFQGNAVINYTDLDTPFTRIIEHKHFENAFTQKTIITKEYSKEWEKGGEAYYPINDDKNTSLYEKYKNASQDEKKVLFCGRLGMYKYFDMDKIIEEVFGVAKKEGLNF